MALSDVAYVRLKFVVESVCKETLSLKPSSKLGEPPIGLDELTIKREFLDALNSAPVGFRDFLKGPFQASRLEGTVALSDLASLLVTGSVFSNIAAYRGVMQVRMRKALMAYLAAISGTPEDQISPEHPISNYGVTDATSRDYKFLNVLDYLNLRLTGRFVATYDSILTSWVTDNRQPDGIHYDERLVRDCGIAGDKLPEIVPCTAVLGTVREEVAAALGLPRTVQVVAGAIDNSAAAVGSGAVADYATHLYIGTSSWLATHVPYKKTDIFASLASVPCAVPGRYLLTALQATAGGNPTFLRDNILYHQDELLQEAHVPDIFKVLDQMATRTPAGANGVIYTPWIWGERAPVDDRTLRAGLYNLSLHNTRADIIRAFLEGVAFNTRWLLLPVTKFLGQPVNSINIVGGGAQSDVWCQIFADVLNVEIRQVKEPIYANARGAAWIAAVGLGEINYTDIPKLMTFQREYTPTLAHRALYDDRFTTFTQIYQQMKTVYKRLNG